MACLWICVLIVGAVIATCHAPMSAGSPASASHMITSLIRAAIRDLCRSANLAFRISRSSGESHGNVFLCSARRALCCCLRFSRPLGMAFTPRDELKRASPRPGKVCACKCFEESSLKMLFLGVFLTQNSNAVCGQKRKISRQTFALVARNMACVLRPRVRLWPERASEAELQFRAVTQFAAIVTDSQSCASRGFRQAGASDNRKSPRREGKKGCPPICHIP